MSKTASILAIGFITNHGTLNREPIQIDSIWLGDIVLRQFDFGKSFSVDEEIDLIADCIMRAKVEGHDICQLQLALSNFKWMARILPFGFHLGFGGEPRRLLGSNNETVSRFKTSFVGFYVVALLYPVTHILNV